MADIPKSRNWILIVLVLIGLWLMSAIAANFMTVFTAEPQTTGNVAIIPVKGAITGDGSGSLRGAMHSSQNVVKMIEKAGNDNKIEAVILEINSPGGTAVASEEIARAVERLNKTTVAWIREVGASGAYWVASASDHIVASRASATGSIGVIGSYLEFSGLLEEYNVTYQRLVGGEYKDIGSPFKELTPDERDILTDKIDGLHDYFMEVVAENRNMSMSEVREISNGLFYFGEEAMELGLVDQLGGKREAIEYVEKELNITAKTVKYEQQIALIDILGNLMSEHGFAIGKGLRSSDNNDIVART